MNNRSVLVCHAIDAVVVELALGDSEVLVGSLMMLTIA